MFPRVLFQINEKLDIAMAIAFWGCREGGIDFTKGIIGPHPVIRPFAKLSSVPRETALRSYVRSYYRRHRRVLQTIAERFQKQWDQKAEEFFTELKYIFGGAAFPKGDYRGFVSIFNLNPRFLKDKAFQVYRDHPRGPIYVAAHELTHFMFYAYSRRRFSRFFKNADPDNGSYWSLAELFNAVVLSDPRFMKIHGNTHIDAYPAHRRYLPRLRAVWRKTHDVDIFIEAGWKLLQ
ncbi:MAG: hypothetical protein AAB479_03225 [Patescibacteria group bacterium]